MNNRFKFRVWLPSLNKFGNDNSVFMDCYGKLYGVTRPSLVDDSRSIVNIGQFKEFNEYTIQWYTGLNDKNDNLIFEGDIVQYNQNSSYDNMNFIARWSDNQLGFIFQSNSGEQLVNQTPHLNRFKHLEVVGNIFENPELLK